MWLILGCLVLSLGSRCAEASVAMLLEMPYGGMGAFNPTGHAALYFDHLCAASPTSLRPCEPGELGVVLSRYDGIGTLDWVAIPLVPYLYGVESPDDIPATMDRLTALRMRDLYRREHLETVAPDTAEGGMPPGNWYELVGSAFDRTLYGFQVKTTPDQDAALMAYFNDRPNLTRYDGAFRNCADFTRIVLNHLYPHAIRRNYVADFGLTTPKSVARGLVKYAQKHPELELESFRVPQVEGSIPRSMAIQGVTGSLVTRYAVPMAIVAPQVTAVVFLAYLRSGRFSVPKHAQVLDASALRSMSSQTLVTREGSRNDGPEVTTVAAEPGVPSATGDGIWPGAFLTSPECGFCEAVPFLP